MESYTFVKEKVEELKANQDFSECKCHFFKNGEDKELLDVFLTKEDASLRDLFFDIYEAKGIYYAPKEKTPYTVYNSLQNIPNIFLIYSSFDVEALNDFIHELGHVKCEMEINETNSRVALQYSYCSLYQEVMPFYYEKKFLSFLISNNIHKQEAQAVLFDNLERRKKELKKCSKLLQKNQPNYEKLFSDLPYIYGIFVANSCVFSPDVKAQFENILYHDFSADAFLKMGLTKERFQKDLTTYTKQYFK